MDKKARGFVNGFIGVAIFSGSLPATRLAVMDLNPFFLSFARASIAGCLALVLLLIFRESRPSKKQGLALVTVALGVVVGFPLLTALALQYITSAQSMVFIGLLPLVTATFGVLRGGERPRMGFWIFSCLGSALVAGYALRNGFGGSFIGDALMLAAIIVCGFGYAEGAVLSRALGGWQVISWALVIALPAMLIASVFAIPHSFENVQMSAWLGLIYVSLFSMLIGFFFWYRGLAQGGIAAVGQLQLLQPFMGLTLAATLLGEAVDPTMIAISIGVVACVFGAKKFSG
jgi:drug/metabolite transporter (DMT)-like permease